MRVECRAPVRVDLAGGWSDIPPFASREGGAVVNIAITRYVMGYAERDDMGRLRVSYGIDVPSGAGLGSSAALSVAWLALVHATMGQEPPAERLAAEACDLGRVLGIAGGKQDEYAAAVGGLHLMHFGAESVDVEAIEAPALARAELEERLVVVYSGQARLSGDIHDRVWGAYERGDTAVAATLGRLRDIALETATALRDGDLERVGGLLNENWEAQRRLHPTITNPRVDALFACASSAGAVGGKACGAGGGGCLAFLAAPGTAPALRAALVERGALDIEAAIDWRGVTVTRTL